MPLSKAASRMTASQRPRLLGGRNAMARRRVSSTKADYLASGLAPVLATRRACSW
jgi:hypothetical protein